MSKHIRCLAIVFALSHSLNAADWPQWRGPNRNGISAETGWSSQWPAGGPKQLWKLNVGIGCSSVAASKGRVYTMGNQADTDTVWCLDANSGATLWKHSYACKLDPNMFEGGSGATPTVDGDRVYTLSRSGHLLCLHADTGKVIWLKHLQNDLGGNMPTWGYAGSPLVLDNLVIADVGAPGAATVAFDNMTGNVVWKNGDEGAGYGSLFAFKHQGRVCLASFDAFGLVVRDSKDGKLLARQKWKTNFDINVVTPIVDGDKIFVSSGYGKGAALFQLTDSELKYVWQTQKMRNHFNSCILWQNHLYGFDENKLTCLDFADGTVKWTQENLGKGSLMLADGKLIIQSEQGDLVIAEASSSAFKEIARAKVLSGRCWVVPVLANGRIYCKNNAGDLVCVDVAKGD